MLFHTSIRKELARTFGATLLVLLTITTTLMLVRTLGSANSGSVNPQEVLLVLGYTALSQLAMILTLSLFISIVTTLTRMHKDSEMVIWMAAGRGLGSLLTPIFRFAWPILLVFTLLSLLAWPWTNEQMDLRRQRFTQRGDLERVAPGQFQESAKGRRVFFIDKDSSAGVEGRNVFISNVEPNGDQNVTSARGGRLEVVGDNRFLVLERGQRLDMTAGHDGVKVTEFREFASQVGSATPDLDKKTIRNTPTWELLRQPSRAHLGELGWRLGVPLVALNLVLFGLAVAVGNARGGRSGTLPFTLLAFVFYNNLLNVGQSWVSRGMVDVVPHMLALHGSVLLFSLLWIAKRHRQWVWRDLLARAQPATGPQAPSAPA